MNNSRFGLCKIGLCKQCILQDLDRARFGSGKIWIVQDLDRKNLDHKNLDRKNLDRAIFRSSKIWILLYATNKIMSTYFKNDFNPLCIYNIHRPLWIIWCGIAGPLRLVLHCYNITFSLHLLTPNFEHTFKQSVWYNLCSGL